LWDVIVPELERQRLMSRLDGVTLQALCATCPLEAPRRRALLRGVDERVGKIGA
jgi:hypothetical protein